MRPNPELAHRIAESDAKLTLLEDGLAKINDPAGDRLRERLKALKIEEKALKRNFNEASGDCPDHQERIERVKRLLAQVQQEEASIEHEKAFLEQASPSTVILAAEAGSRAARKVGSKVRRIIGNRHPLGWSVFVNHTHDDLVARHGLPEESHEQKPPETSATRRFLRNLRKRTETIGQKPETK